MNIAIIGKSSINVELNKNLVDEGFTTICLEDINTIEGLEGEKGGFTIYKPEGELQAGYIIITGEPEYTDGLSLNNETTIPALSLMTTGGVDLPDDKGKPVVILLDYPIESWACMTNIALMRAIELSKKKKKVIYMSRFMRTAKAGMEALYREARNCGVAFIKYDDIIVEKESHDNGFVIKVSDGYDFLTVNTNVLIHGGAGRPGHSAGLAAKIFKLRTDEHGYISGFNYFVSPTLTSRSGIYAIGGGVSAGIQDDVNRDIQYTISAIKKECTGQPNEKYVLIDADKCAFCYNCYRACPHSAMAPDRDNPVMKNLNEACFGCGLCVSICPADAIRLADREEPKGHKGSLMVLCCENSGEIAAQRLIRDLDRDYGNVHIVSMNCGGELSVETILQGVKDFDKVVIAVCMDGACKHFDGNKRAWAYTKRAKKLLKDAGFDENRIDFINISQAMANVLDDHIKDTING
ncbi:MAG: hydrogenase iron-sulfur subunit [Mahellales bacterium]|jgi:ferredoxin